MPKSSKPSRPQRRRRTGVPVRQERRLRVEGELHEEPNVQKLARAIIELALRQAAEEAAAQAEHETEEPS